MPRWLGLDKITDMIKEIEHLCYHEGYTYEQAVEKIKKDIEAEKAELESPESDKG